MVAVSRERAGAGALMMRVGGEQVLKSLDQIHFLIRGDAALAERISSGDRLSRQELRALLAACPPVLPPPVATPQAGAPFRGAAGASEVSPREVELLDQVLSSASSSMDEKLSSIERSALLDELSRWATRRRSSNVAGGSGGAADPRLAAALANDELGPRWPRRPPPAAVAGVAGDAAAAQAAPQAKAPRVWGPEGGG